jgi:hypothetical protein
VRDDWFAKQVLARDCGCDTFKEAAAVLAPPAELPRRLDVICRDINFTLRGEAAEKCRGPHGCLSDAAGPVSVTAQHLWPGPMNGS